MLTPDEPLKIFVCDQCPKTFVRSDLLFRHKDRHAKKALKKCAVQTRNLKTIRPAGSDSGSSRGGQSPPSPASIGFRSYETSCSSSVDSGHGRSHSSSFPRTLHQLEIIGSPGSLEDFKIGRPRSNTLPLPISPNMDFTPPFRQGPFEWHLAGAEISPVLPPIREHSYQQHKTRTYSVESILNEPI